MKIEPELLRVLIAFGESKNLIAAAELLRITQPAVTQRLKRLQDQVPLPLYAFEGRKKVLTPYGKGLFELSKENFRQLEVGFENLNRHHASASHLVLRLGCRKELFEVFSQTVKFAGRVEYNKMTESQALENLDRDEIDVALTSTVVSSPDYVNRKIFEGSCRFVFHSKLMDDIRSFRDLQKHESLLLKTPSVLHKTETTYFDKFARTFKLKPNDFNCKAVLEDWSSLLGLVENKVGYAIVPAFLQSDSENIVSFDIPHATIPRMSYYAVYHRKLKKIEAFKKALEVPTYIW
jgi:DNA-binding transcriptional LysR family regulator